MPLEIKELHIRVNVNQPQPAESGSTATGANVDAKPEDPDGIVRQCIEQVIELMNAKKER